MMWQKEKNTQEGLSKGQKSLSLLYQREDTMENIQRGNDTVNVPCMKEADFIPGILHRWSCTRSLSFVQINVSTSLYR